MKIKILITVIMSACILNIQAQSGVDHSFSLNEAREFSNNAGFALEFQRLLFSRVMPNLSRIGLLTDKVRPLYDQLGVLEFESHSNDGDISWAELEKPLDLSA